jgi:uncharacterized membrane protein
MAWEKDLERWVDARLIDSPTAVRIRDFENTSDKKRLRWPAILAISFGALMLCAGILLFVASHWDEMAPSQRFLLILSMVGVFHIAASILGEKMPSMGIALHVAGTASLGAAIYMAGQIFNLQEHWPGGLLLWSLGAATGWLLLRQWPQALLAAVLVPWWLAGEWFLATEGYRDAVNIAAQGLLLLSIFYLTASPKEPNRLLLLGMVWVGALSLIPMIPDVIFSAAYSGSDWWPWRSTNFPIGLKILGYAGAYLPVLVLAAIKREKRSIPMFGAAIWVFLLAIMSSRGAVESSPWVYLWVGLGACALCYWGVHDNRKLFINYGTALFAIDLIAFYFSNVLDKLGRSMGLILLGVIFLAGGWVLNRLRGDLIARAAAVGASR